MVNSAKTTTASVQETGGIGLREIAAASGAGLVGTIAMSPLLAVAWYLGVISPSAFQGLATIVGLGPSLPIGLVIFVGGGTATLPLLFVALAMFLPGRTSTEKGIIFAGIVWNGWAFAFFSGQTGATLAAFLVVGLLSHVVYGAVLGTIYGRYAQLPEYQV